jgi:entericidin B
MTLRTYLLPLIALIALTACETIEGAGRDIEGAGEAITDQSQETQAEM